ncbi:hypothetical protein RhiJN_26887 [Ceratobasidium sp. AG-Ba]|nr:hypothetical protein RhiJN_05106 [Ceratobasidium sp. AG-Ba]QRV90314.1 hypothetical protein RhiJN_18332 [Ceratobasidium sp. AG-Ba]QRV96297.1 hypothetical protein RhiJN_24315 [Ceratobasidium sp. AG-Ba]QRV98868.1 hypothetical protein RhiJN_26887 [Ceratobasidium sp. AG-Ba]
MAPVQSKPVVPGSKSKPKPKPKPKPTTRSTASKVQKAKASSSKVPAPAEDSEEESVPQGDDEGELLEENVKIAAKGGEGEGDEEDGEGKGGRQAGAFGYDPDMCDYLCDLVENRLPQGPAGWELLAAAYNEKFPERQRDGPKLKKKFFHMGNINPIPTGNRPIDIIHRRAIHLKSMLSTSVNSISVNDKAVPHVYDTDEEGQDEDEEANNDDSGLSVQVMDPPPKKEVPLKTPGTKSKNPPSLKPKGKSRQIEPFPISALGKLDVKSKSSKVPLAGDDDSSSEPEILNDPVATTPGIKRKAEDQGTIVVRKKPASSTANTPAKGAALRRQQAANGVVDRVMEHTDPARFEEMSRARQQSATDAALLLTREGHISDLQRDIGALRDSKDAQIASLQRDIGNLRDAKDATITGLQSEMGKIRDHHEQEVRQMRNQHEKDMREARDQYEREIRNERDSRYKAENELTQARSLNMIYSVINGQSAPGSGGLLATLGGPSGAGFGAMPVVNPAIPVDPSSSHPHHQVPVQQGHSNDASVDADGAYIPVNPGVGPQSSNAKSA